LLLAVIAPGPTWAKGNVQATLISERAAVTPGVPFHVGIVMKIRDGWHIYWKNPGDSGLPPKIEWVDLAEGFVAGPIEFPLPHRSAENDLMTYGYDRDVILPVTITPPRVIKTDSVTIGGMLQWLECKDICVPAGAKLRITLPVSSTPVASDSGAAAIAGALSQLPQDPAGWSLRAEAGRRAIALDFAPPRGITPREAYLFVDEPLVTEHAAPQGFERMGNGYRLTLTPAANAAGNLARLSGVLVIEEAGRSGSTIGVNVDVPVVPGGPAPAPVTPQRPGWPILAYAALLGIAGLGLWFQLYRARRKHPNTNP
jgi:thiol:disulfide interchange protein DsbD